MSRQIAAAVRAAAAPRPLRVPLLAVHGGADSVVRSPQRGGVGAAILAPQRSSGGERQYGSDRACPADTERRIELAGGRTEIVSEWRREGRLVARYVEIVGLGHAWSGGDPALEYNDAGHRTRRRWSAISSPDALS